MVVIVMLVIIESSDYKTELANIEMSALERTRKLDLS